MKLTENQKTDVRQFFAGDFESDFGTLAQSTQAMLLQYIFLKLDNPELADEFYTGDKNIFDTKIKDITSTLQPPKFTTFKELIDEYFTPDNCLHMDTWLKSDHFMNKGETPPQNQQPKFKKLIRNAIKQQISDMLRQGHAYLQSDNKPLEEKSFSTSDKPKTLSKQNPYVFGFFNRKTKVPILATIGIAAITAISMFRK